MTNPRCGVAVVAAAPSGSGRALVERFGAEGRFVLTDVEQTALDAAASELRGRSPQALAVRTDGTSAQQVRAFAYAPFSASAASTTPKASLPTGKARWLSLLRRARRDTDTLREVWYPRQESNLRTWFRKPLLYPLSYGGTLNF